MKVAYLIRPDGNHTVEVLDRQGEDCRLVTSQASRMGEITNDEVTGPECDTVHEGTFGGDSSS